jgi:hypothetical protein
MDEDMPALHAQHSRQTPEYPHSNTPHLFVLKIDGWNVALNQVVPIGL